MDPLCVEPGTSVRRVLRLLQKHKAGNVLVCRGGKLAGIFTERDALKMMAHGADFDVPIESVMSADPVVLSPGDSLGTAIAKMAHGGYRQLPMVDDQGRACSVMKVSGILHYLVEQFPEMIYNLPPEPHHRTQQREGA